MNKKGDTAVKKKVIIGIVVLTVLAVVWCAIPRPLVGYSYQLDYIEYQGETIHFHDDSSRAEREEIEALLRTYQRSAVPCRGPWGGDGSLCLTGGDGRRPLHIVLHDGGGGGKPCFMIYSSAEKGGYPIRNGEELLKELLTMLGE